MNREVEEQGGSVFRALRCFWRAKRYMLFMLSLPKERNKKRIVPLCLHFLVAPSQAEKSSYRESGSTPDWNCP